jgi:hypothetical protein
MALVQVLVVDDSTHWLGFVSRYFETKTGYKIIGLAVNGLAPFKRSTSCGPT